MGDLSGRGRRVLGMFISMMGAGLVLESGLEGLGWILTVVGVVVFVATFRRGGLESSSEGKTP